MTGEATALQFLNLSETRTLIGICREQSFPTKDARALRQEKGAQFFSKK
jgi:hypothetical protein